MNTNSPQDRPSVRIPPPLVFFVFLGIASALQHLFGFNCPQKLFELRSAIALLLAAFAGYLALHAVVVLKRRATYVDTNKPTTQIVE